MRFYEISYLVSPNISKEELKNFQEKINSLIQKEGGILFDINPPKKRVLAYPIKKNKEAYFLNLTFHFPEEKIENFEKKLKEEKQILRYLILTKRKPELVGMPKKPSIKKVEKPKKVELKEIEEKLEEILGK